MPPLVETLMFPFFPGFVSNATMMQQPFDISCFRPFKLKMHQRIERLRLTLGVDAVTMHNFHQLMMPVYLECMKPDTVINGFRRAGIHPFDSDNLNWSKISENNKKPFIQTTAS